MIFLYVNQLLLTTVLLVKQLRVRVVHEVITLRGYENARDLNVMHFLYQLKIVEVQLILQRALKEENERFEEDLWNF